MQMPGLSWIQSRSATTARSCRLPGVSPKVPHVPAPAHVRCSSECSWGDIMRKVLAVGGAAALTLWALAASADEITGTISNINLTRNTFVLEGKTYAASPTNTVGTKLSTLKEGD